VQHARGDGVGWSCHCVSYRAVSQILASRSPPDIDRLTVGERANDCPRLIPARVALVMNISGAQGDKIATPSRHAIDADLICLSFHLAVTARADAADGMARRVASDQK
jgi:hypothetical protein